MKVGDIICRKDMPQFLYEIIGENPDWKSFWNVKALAKYRGFKKHDGMIEKDDERWEVVRKGET